MDESENPLPKGVVLLCLDMQASFLGVMADAPAVLRRCQFAVAAARGLGLPVVFTEQMPEKLGPTVAELVSLAPEAPRFAKSTFSALADAGIRQAVEAMNADQILLCGLEAPVCVYQTSLDARQAQLEVTLLGDAIGARRPADASLAIAELIRAGVHVLPAESVFYALLRDARHPFFKAYTQLVKNHA